MRSIKRWLAVITAAAMAVGSMSGCGKSSDTVSTEETGENGKTVFTYWAPLNSSLAQVANSYEDTFYYQELEKRLDIDIEFMHPPVGQEMEQFQLLIASGDLPDIMDYGWLTSYPGGPEKAIEDEIIVPINDYMDQVPHYKEAFESNDMNVKEGTTDSGNIFGFHTLRTEGADLKVMQAMMIRNDWLDELGLELPETIEDWETVFTAFQEKKGSEFPLALKFADIKESENFNTAYRVGNAFYIDDDGCVQYGPAQPAYKEYLTTLNRWYEKGFLNPDFASIDGAYVDSQVLNGKAGAAYAWIGGGLGSWLNAGGENFSMEGTVNPVGEKGEEAFLAASLNTNIGTTTACITTAAAKDEKKMEAILKFFDYLYSEEGLILRTYGVEGTSFEMVDGEAIYKEIITDNPDGLSMAQALSLYTQAPLSGPGYGVVPGYVKQYYQYDEQKTTMDRANAVVDSVEKHTYPGATVTSAEAEELATIMAEVNTMKDEEMIAFITGVRPLDEYDAFVGELKKLGIDRAVEIKQAALDRFNSR